MSSNFMLRVQPSIVSVWRVKPAWVSVLRQCYQPRLSVQSRRWSDRDAGAVAPHKGRVVGMQQRTLHSRLGRSRTTVLMPASAAASSKVPLSTQTCNNTAPHVLQVDHNGTEACEHLWHRLACLLVEVAYMGSPANFFAKVSFIELGSHSCIHVCVRVKLLCVCVNVCVRDLQSCCLVCFRECRAVGRTVL